MKQHTAEKIAEEIRLFNLSNRQGQDPEYPVKLLKEWKRSFKSPPTIDPEALWDEFSEYYGILNRKHMTKPQFINAVNKLLGK